MLRDIHLPYLLSLRRWSDPLCKVILGSLNRKKSIYCPSACSFALASTESKPWYLRSNLFPLSASTVVWLIAISSPFQFYQNPVTMTRWVPLSTLFFLWSIGFDVSIQLRTAKIDNSICGPGNFFDRKLTSDSDSAGLKTSESVENGFFPRLFGLAKILGRFCNTLHPF